MRKPANYWVEKYKMQPHPEGGFFTEAYRSNEVIPQASLPLRFKGDRSYCTGIYFLLEGHHFSAFHRIQSDEMWHFYAGDSLEIFVIYPEGGRIETLRLGADPERGEVFQAVVPAGTWFGSRPVAGSAYSLVGCTVAPGFDFADFELAAREDLLLHYPQFREIITALTR